MKPSHDKIDRIESVSTIIVNLGTLLWWLLSFFTAFVLAWQPQPISLPGILQLGPWYKLIFLLSILFGYIQLLKRNWESQRRKAKDIEATFGSYIYGSIIKVKRPLILIGFLAILGMIGILIFTDLIGLGVALIFAGIVSVVSFFLYDLGVPIKRRYDDEYRKRWLKRVRNCLHENGYAHTVDLQDLPDARYSEINWAIQFYFDLYEFEQKLIFSERYVEKNLREYHICEIRFKHVPSQLSGL
jgi:hypothetical protein